MSVMDGDVFANGTWWDVDDDNKILIHTACGTGVFGDDSRQRHADSCRVDCPDCDGEGIVFDHINYWGKAEDRNCLRCDGTGQVLALVLT